jgi:ADP-heptose:LPS heptosyltransferase
MNKTACVVRYGAFGDAIMVTPLLRVLKEEGYHVTVNCSWQVIEVLKHNPFVDKIIEHKKDSIPANQLDEYWDEMSKDYDKFINLSESIEGALLKVEGRKEFNWDGAKRHAECNVNYYDQTLKLGGYENITGKNGELYFSKLEEKIGRDYRKKYKKKFLILWSLSGSSYHKTYPFAEYVARGFLKNHPDAMIMTVGDNLCTLLEWSDEQTKSYSGKWPIRKSMIMTKYADLVVGSETGILNASGCFDTPKIVMLSHSSHENLSKYWKNTHPVNAEVECYPCHQLHYSLESCKVDRQIKSPVCMAKLSPSKVLVEMDKIYNNWKENR